MTTSASPKIPPKKSRKLLKVIGWILLFIPILIILSIPVGAAYQAIATTIEDRLFPPPGTLVEIEGKQMHLFCQGEGSPTVVFESGMGNSGYSFLNIHKQLAGRTRVCLYDRPSLGWSTVDETWYMKDQVSQHLHSILEQAGEKPPYLMVGHSMGGVYIRAFYHLFPDEVVGMVFVDSAHENEMAFYPEPEGSTPDYFSTMMDFCEFIAGVGVLRATGVMGEILEGSPGTALEQRQILSRLNRVSYCKGIRVEKEVSDIELSQTTPPASLGDLPLIVLVGAKQLNPIRNQFYIGPLPPAQRQNTQTWQEIQAQLAALSTNSEMVQALQSGHYVHWDEPQLVVDAINKLLDGYSQSQSN